MSVKATKSRSATITFWQCFSASLAALGFISIPTTEQPFLFSRAAKYPVAQPKSIARLFSPTKLNILLKLLLLSKLASSKFDNDG